MRYNGKKKTERLFTQIRLNHNSDGNNNRDPSAIHKINKVKWIPA